MEARGLKKQRILKALLQGRVLTPHEANEIGRTSDATRIIRKLREENWHIRKERVAGEPYYRYWMDEAFRMNFKAE